jgi:hypothetical protein
MDGLGQGYADQQPKEKEDQRAALEDLEDKRVQA